MTMVNQAGEEIQEETLFAHGHAYEQLDLVELNEAVALLCNKLNMKLVRTNATKYGHIELRLVDVEE